jgi:hypothetical protein
VIQRAAVPSDLDEHAAEDELGRALAHDEYGSVPSIRVRTEERPRSQRDLDKELAALDVSMAEPVLRVAVDLAQDHALDAALGAVFGELVERVVAAFKGRRPERSPFPDGSVFDVAREIVARASRMLELPPRALVPQSAVGNTERVDVYARVSEQDGSRFYHAWGTREGEFGVEQVSASDWRGFFDQGAGPATPSA